MEEKRCVAQRSPRSANSHGVTLHVNQRKGGGAFLTLLLYDDVWINIEDRLEEITGCLSECLESTKFTKI